MRRIFLFGVILGAVLTACASPTPVPVSQTPSAPTLQPTSAPGAYRPLEKGNVVEGIVVDYSYILPSAEHTNILPSAEHTNILPSADKPVIQIALGQNLLQLIQMNTQMTTGLVAFIQELTNEPRNIFAFDENDPSQTQPAMVMIAANRPVEIVIAPMPEGKHNWSVTETQEGSVRAAYKLIRRASDGGLRYVMAYDLTALNNFVTLLPGGNGGGLVFSSRLAALKSLLSDPAYQRGENVLETKPLDVKAYDPRVLTIDPSREGLAQNVAWVLISRPAPNPGQQP